MSRTSLFLLVASFGGGGLLYAYTPKDGKWSVLTDLKGSGPHALTYHPKEDALFGLRTDYDGDSGGIPVLLRHNDRGALVNRTKLGEPMFPGLISQEPLGTHLQLVAAGDYVVAITTSGMHPGQQPNPQAYMYLIEPKTGKVRLTWRNPER